MIHTLHKATYNISQFHTYSQVNERLVVEGVLRVSWGVLCPIQLQPKDEALPKSWRRSYHIAMENGLEEDLRQLVRGNTRRKFYSLHVRECENE